MAASSTTEVTACKWGKRVSEQFVSKYNGRSKTYLGFFLLLLLLGALRGLHFLLSLILSILERSEELGKQTRALGALLLLGLGLSLSNGVFSWQ